MAKIIFIFCALIPFIFAQCTVEKAEPFFSRSVYEFSIDLVGRIAQDTDYHFVTSTLSAWTLLAYTSLGAADKTLEELNTILRLHPHKCFNKKFFEITKSVYSPATDTTLEGTSAIFVDERIPVKEVFQNKVKRAGVSEVKQVSFDNYDYVAAYINNYVKTATNGAIDEIVLASDLENVALMIIDALRFKSAWKIPFPINETEESAFYDEMNNKLGDVNLMFVTDNYNIKIMDKINASVIDLPYGNDRFSMLLFVPYEGIKLSNLIHSLKKISLKSIFSLFKKQEPHETMVQLPRFKISSDLNNLRELFIDMGLRTIFDSNQAQFPDISDYPLYISNIIQKADVEVTEEGTVASAVSTAAFSFKSLPDLVVANRPFFFMIVDKKTVIPIFAGAYSKPSKY
ncbi:unnamed protein product [Parnassius apollo]|uniref:(apollo) hypothetical protein n=1 Tax=Parnassius apollo TaxID=110799 RepID=A0A8S3X147_PARAO|nr:unnamed protein product [Parnassius apollo]